MDKTDWRDTERIPSGPKPGWGRNYLQGNLGTVLPGYPTQRRGQWLLFRDKWSHKDAPGITKRECKTMSRMGAAILWEQDNAHVQDSRASGQKEPEMHYHQGYVVKAPGCLQMSCFMMRNSPHLLVFAVTRNDEDSYLTSKDNSKTTWIRFPWTTYWDLNFSYCKFFNVVISFLNQLRIKACK